MEDQQWDMIILGLAICGRFWNQTPLRVDNQGPLYIYLPTYLYHIYKTVVKMSTYKIYINICKTYAKHFNHSFIYDTDYDICM